MLSKRSRIGPMCPKIGRLETGQDPCLNTRQFWISDNYCSKYSKFQSDCHPNVCTISCKEWKENLCLLPYEEYVRPSSCGKTVNYGFLYFLPCIAVNLPCWMDNNQLLNCRLSKTINNFHYTIAIKTKLNNKFIVLKHFLLPKQH